MARAFSSPYFCASRANSVSRPSLRLLVSLQPLPPSAVESSLPETPAEPSPQTTPPRYSMCRGSGRTPGGRLNPSRGKARCSRAPSEWQAARFARECRPCRARTHRILSLCGRSCRKPKRGLWQPEAACAAP